MITFWIFAIALTITFIGIQELVKEDPDAGVLWVLWGMIFFFFAYWAFTSTYDLISAANELEYDIKEHEGSEIPSWLLDDAAEICANLDNPLYMLIPGLSPDCMYDELLELSKPEG